MGVILEEGKQASVEGAILWMTWLMRGVGDQSGALTTLEGTPHTQQAADHHAGYNHSNATNHP